VNQISDNAKDRSSCSSFYSRCTYGLSCTVRVISITEHFDVPI